MDDISKRQTARKLILGASAGVVLLMCGDDILRGLERVPAIRKIANDVRSSSRAVIEAAKFIHPKQHFEKISDALKDAGR